VTHLNGIIKLNDFQVEAFNVLDVKFVARFLDCSLQVSILLLGLLGVREQIGDNVLEKRKIVNQELGDVDVTKSTQKELIFGHVRVGSLK
jgi:hypothetical protein